MSITSGLSPVRGYANGGMSEEEQFKDAMKEQGIAKLEEALGIRLPRGSEESEEALINNILGNVTDLPIQKRGDEYTYGDDDGFSFYVNPEEEGAGVRYNKRFADGGIAAYADGGDADSGFFNYQKTAEGSGANLRDFTDLVFDPTDPVDYLVAGLMVFPPAGIAAKLLQAGVKGNKLRKTMNKVEALKNAERGAGQKAKDLFTTNPAENIAAANGLLLGPTRKGILATPGQMAIRQEAADLVTTNNRGIENIGPVELYSDEALAEIKEDPSITKKGGIGELVEMGRDAKELYNLAKDPEIRGSMIDDMRSGIGNFISGDQSNVETEVIEKDALDEAETDIADVNKKELTKGQRGIKALAMLAEAYANSQNSGDTGTQGYMIQGRGISTPEITRYQEGGIANMDPMMMANGGIAKFADGSGKKGVIKRIIKSLKDKADQARDALNKAKKSETKKKPDTKKKETTEKKTKTEKAKEEVMRALPPEIVVPAAAIGRGTYSFGKKILEKAGREGGMGRGAVRTIGYPALGYGVYDYLSSDAANVTLPEDENKEDTTPEPKESNAMRDIHYAKSLERAQAAGRTEPVFMDYLASFPGSYTDKLGKDPEFARQMMAGFLAMMQPSEGFVPRNAIADFGQAAMAEGVRQEEGLSEQEKLLAMSDEDISRLQNLQAGGSKLTKESQLAAQMLLTKFKTILTGDEDGEVVDANNPGVLLNDISMLALMQETNEDPNELAKRIIRKT